MTAYRFYRILTLVMFSRVPLVTLRCRAGPRENGPKTAARRDKSPGEVKYAFSGFLCAEKGGCMKNERKIAWVCLIIAGLIEFVWGYFLKESHGFSEVGPAILAVIFIAASFFLLERAVRVFGIGMSYGVFTGLGIAGTSIIGILALGESISVLKIISLIILMTGIVGIKFCDGKEEGKGAEEK